ncbi:hypothetical protein BJ085DRAFT_30807 [Dimargaris cristalligena]|uniref:F-box domain-containing protein n=1 Tax=Dimargaris cristalligena TaxID=215637 RepID=A0A4P9ZUF7_9FUNG|nr:hypothetical protein BJ085DRAFT_30807 [Dimargaris cristalligena]|eukprot:RKP36511.1 hypothetical protein BJ085DRAFT_30807 [Dimargaris cristalligena]
MLTLATTPPTHSVGLELLQWLLSPARFSLGRRLIGSLTTHDQVRLAATCHLLRHLVEPIYQLDCQHRVGEEPMAPALARILSSQGDAIRSLEIQLLAQTLADDSDAAWAEAHRIFRRLSHLDSLTVQLDSFGLWPVVADWLTSLPKAPRQLNVVIANDDCFNEPEPESEADAISEGCIPDATCDFLGRIRSLSLHVALDIEDFGIEVVSADSIAGFLYPFVGLRSLRINSKTTNDSLTQLLVNNFSTLDRLELIGGQWNCGILFNPDQLTFRRLTGLELALDNNEASAGSFSRICALNYPYLTNLKLHYSNYLYESDQLINRDQIQLFDQPWSSITSLTITNTLLSDMLGSLIVHHFPKLTHVRISECPNMAPICIEMVSKCRQLSSVALWFCNKAEASAFWESDFTNHSVTRLSLSHVVCPDFLNTALRRLPNLQEIGLPADQSADSGPDFYHKHPGIRRVNDCNPGQYEDRIPFLE